MALLPAIRLVASSSKSTLGKIYLQCHIKPGASRHREGILSVSRDVIEVCVAAPAKEGEANKAVREVLCSVLKCPKSDVEVIRGLKSREKTIAVGGIDVRGDEEGCILRIREMLESAADG